MLKDHKYTSDSLLVDFRGPQPEPGGPAAWSDEETAGVEDHKWTAAAQTQRLHAGGQRRGRADTCSALVSFF